MTREFFFPPQEQKRIKSGCERLVSEITDQVTQERKGWRKQ